MGRRCPHPPAAWLWNSSCIFCSVFSFRFIVCPSCFLRARPGPPGSLWATTPDASLRFAPVGLSWFSSFSIASKVKNVKCLFFIKEHSAFLWFRCSRRTMPAVGWLLRRPGRPLQKQASHLWRTPGYASTQAGSGPPRKWRRGASSPGHEKLPRCGPGELFDPWVWMPVRRSACTGR